MRYGIFGDIHSNLSALRAAHAALTQRGVERFLSVGDVVGYGAAPGECIDFLQDIDALVVRGNHDAACAGLLDPIEFNVSARQAIAWTRRHLEREHLEWLRQLPLTLKLADCQVTHGSFENPAEFNYTLDIETAAPSFSFIERVGFVGHSHIPIMVVQPYEAGGKLALCVEDSLLLDEIHKALINVGSVGQPRDEDPRCAVGYFDSEAQRIEILRLAYDLDREVARIRQAGLPTVLADRLRLGL
jgi:diadenosine tetraphosphatase ApaH/serine/threonine PP2A family protein phosphatase